LKDEETMRTWAVPAVVFVVKLLLKPVTFPGCSQLSRTC
jgi:hypothetical protein